MKLSSLAISTLFVLITLGSSLKMAGTISYYALFTQDFVERFCENKTKPELKCEGKCALSQILLQELDNEKVPINLDFLKNETILFMDSLINLKFLQLPIEVADNLQCSNLYNFNFVDRIIHPPQL